MTTQTPLPVVVTDEQPFMSIAFAREIDERASLHLAGVARAFEGNTLREMATSLDHGVLLVGCRSLTVDLARELEPISTSSTAFGIALLCTEFSGEAVLHAQRLCAGARKGFGLFLKDSINTGNDLEQFLLSVGMGNVVIDPRVISDLMDPPDRPSAMEFSSLTEREMGVLKLMADGLTNTGIADELGVQRATADRHTHNIYFKLGADCPSNMSPRTHAVNIYTHALLVA
jgi:DNA-binding NarL/FixJ family response regulator